MISKLHLIEDNKRVFTVNCDNCKNSTKVKIPIGETLSDIPYLVKIEVLKIDWFIATFEDRQTRQTQDIISCNACILQAANME